MPLGLSQGIVTFTLGRRSATTGVKPDGMVRMPLGLSQGIVTLHASKNLARPQDLPAGHQLNLLQTAQTSRLDAGGQPPVFSKKSVWHQHAAGRNVARFTDMDV